MLDWRTHASKHEVHIKNYTPPPPPQTTSTKKPTKKRSGGFQGESEEEEEPPEGRDHSQATKDRRKIQRTSETSAILMGGLSNNIVVAMKSAPFKSGEELSENVKSVVASLEKYNVQTKEGYCEVNQYIYIYIML
jgi:hypothetical protein